MAQPQVSILVPLYNEQESLPMLVERLNKVMESSPFSTEVVLVNDGSSDHTADIMRQLALTDSRYHSVFLARNYGHQLALTAGLSVVRATEGVMIIDGDLQDPPELLAKFYEQYKAGYDVVYAVRKKRKEGFFKKAAYYFFYRLLKNISYTKIPLDSGDFCFISRRVTDILNKMPEESRYLRGMRSWIGFRQIGIPYERDSRHAGTSKYSLSRLAQLAFNGIFNFSEYPVKLLWTVGLLTILISLIYLVLTILKKVIYGTVPPGYTSLLIVLILFNGVHLLSLGLLGEYILRIFFQSKGRPLFIVAERIEKQEVVNG